MQSALLVLAHVAAIVLLAPPSTAIQSTSLYEPAPYQACQNKSALCFGLPANCLATKNCEFLFRSHYDAKNGFNLSLIAPNVQVDQYIAVGFSDQSQMNGLVVQCFHSSTTNKDVIQLSFNVGYQNSLIVNQRDVTGFSNLHASYENGQLNCQWQVNHSTKVHYKRTDFDFENTKYYIKLAKGPVSFDAIEQHTDRLVSSVPMDLKSTGMFN